MIRPTTTSARRAPRPAYVPGRIVFKLREDVFEGVPDLAALPRAARAAFTLPEALSGPLVSLERRKAISGITPLFPAEGALSGRRAPSNALKLLSSVRESQGDRLQGLNVLELSRPGKEDDVVRDLSATRGDELVERVPARWLAAAPAASDPLLNRQWGLRAINWFGAQPLPDASEVAVGVLDTGIDASHPDLPAGTYTHDGVSADDIIGHGTHVAGIIAAVTNNSVGIAGVCRCNLQVWKVFEDEPASDGEYYVDPVMFQRALNDARVRGIKVVNLSLGGTVPSTVEAMLIERLIEAGCVVVAAIGNEFEEGNPVEYPAAYPDVLAVGAIDETNRRARFSNTGKVIGLVAPGRNILSTLPMKKSSTRPPDEVTYAAWSGTSMATPHVAGAAALVRAKFPGLPANAVARKLTATAQKLPAMRGKAWTREHGSGLLDVRAAL